MKYILLFQGRTGSSYLMDALGRHSQIVAGGEILASYSNADSQLRRMADFYHKSEFQGCKACGFKTKLRDILDKNGFRDLLLSEQIRVIYLERKNVIKTVVSKFNAFRLNNLKGVWNITDDNDRVMRESINIDEFDKWLKGTVSYKEELERFVSNLDLPVLFLYYEDLMLNESELFKKVFGFLDVESEDIKGRFIKYTDDDLKKSLVNFSELKAHYKGTAFEKMFDEVLIRNN